MKRVSIVALLLTMFTVGCATSQDRVKSQSQKTQSQETQSQETQSQEIQSQEIQTETQPYVRLLQTEMAVRQIDLSYPANFRVYITKNLGKRFPNVAGLCSKVSDKIIVRLDQDVWSKLDDIGREMIIFHELGHCILDLPHNNTAFRDGLPISLMYHSLFDSNVYYRYRSQFLNQMALEFHELYARAAEGDEQTPSKQHKLKTLHVTRLSDSFKKRYSLE